jgi:hypothetical protein
MRRTRRWKSGQAQADRQRAESEQDAAGKRPLAQPEDNQAGRLHPSIYRVEKINSP